MSTFQSLFSVIYTLTYIFVVESSWNVTISHNPGCNLSTECEKYDLIYINARNSTSSVHVFITASERFPLPSVLIVHSSVAETNPLIDWGKLNISSGKSLNISNVTQSYALVFYKMLEYNDLDDNVNMSIYSQNSDQILIHNFDEYQWRRSLVNDGSLIFENNLFEIAYNGTSSKMNSSEQVIIKFRISNTTQHHKEMPHLLLTPGWIVQFDVLFNNLTSHFKQSRFGLQLAMISNLTLSPTEEFRKDMTNFLLGESVSKLNNKKLVNTDKHSKNSTNPPAFIQIKPACFIDNQWRTVQNSRNVYVSKHQDLLNDEDSLRYSLPSIFYADRINPNTIDNNTGLMPIGIRLTASFGLGNPPKDNLSSLLIGLIVCSMLIIVSAVILGILLVIILRRRTTLDRPILSHFVNDPIA
ncbi:Lysosomal protein NCU-G1-B [Schistosoma japonicum]|nr:Lysosomal protein NCU-G1-B [Schistosoma japonicum]